MNKWLIYEEKKKKLQQTCKTFEEYEKKLRKLIKKLCI